MSERPESVQIGPYRYTITADADALMRHEHERQNRVWGCIRWMKMEILLDPQAPEQRHRETLLHEIIHGCNDVAGTGSLDDEERFVTALAPVLLDTLRRNPDLLTYLTSEVN